MAARTSGRCSLAVSSPCIVRTRSDERLWCATVTQRAADHCTNVSVCTAITWRITQRVCNSLLFGYLCRIAMSVNSPHKLTFLKILASSLFTFQFLLFTAVGYYTYNSGGNIKSQNTPPFQNPVSIYWALSIRLSMCSFKNAAVLYTKPPSLHKTPKLKAKDFDFGVPIRKLPSVPLSNVLCPLQLSLASFLLVLRQVGKYFL